MLIPEYKLVKQKNNSNSGSSVNPLHGYDIVPLKRDAIAWN